MRAMSWILSFPKFRMRGDAWRFSLSRTERADMVPSGSVTDCSIADHPHRAPGRIYFIMIGPNPFLTYHQPFLINQSTHFTSPV